MIIGEFGFFLNLWLNFSKLIIHHWQKHYDMFNMNMHLQESWNCVLIEPPVPVCCAPHANSIFAVLNSESQGDFNPLEMHSLLVKNDAHVVFSTDSIPILCLL